MYPHPRPLTPGLLGQRAAVLHAAEVWAATELKEADFSRYNRNL